MPAQDGGARRRSCMRNAVQGVATVYLPWLFISTTRMSLRAKLLLSFIGTHPPPVHHFLSKDTATLLMSMHLTRVTRGSL